MQGAAAQPFLWDAVIVRGGLAGLSAAIYLGRSRLQTLLVDGDHSMARWEPIVENYLGFPEGISGESLLTRGRDQVLFEESLVDHRLARFDAGSANRPNVGAPV